MARPSCLFLVFAPLAMLACSRDPSVGRTQLTSAEVVPVQNAQVEPAPAAPPAPAQPVPTARPMFEGEQAIDTSAPPVLETRNLKTSKVRTVPDEQLPKWVPKRGRLTVVDSSDLAENLGLVPKGTTKTSEERISVAEKLAEESAARAAAADSTTASTSFTWVGPGRFRSRL